MFYCVRGSRWTVESRFGVFLLPVCDERVSDPSGFLIAVKDTVE